MEVQINSDNSSIIKVWKNSKIYKRKIKKCMCNDDIFQMIVPRLNENSYIVAHVNQIGDWESFLHCYVKNDTTLCFATGYTKYENRRQGLSTKLRHYIIQNNKHIHKFESLTLPDSKSDLLLEKMGFVKEGNRMVKYNY